MKISKKDAKWLAVAYHAYLDANEKDDANGIEVWGRILMRYQMDCGVTLQNHLDIEGRIASVKGR